MPTRRLLISISFFVTISTVLLGQTTGNTQAKNFSFKGIRLGMPVEEFKDSMSTLPFLKKPDYITDYFGISQTTVDSMTASVAYYRIELSLGCKEQYGSTSCATVETLSLSFLGGQIVGIRMYEFNNPFVSNLLAIATAGIESKLGKPTKDHRKVWEENDIDEVDREETHVYAEWIHRSGKDTIEAGVDFEMQEVDKDWYSERSSKFYPVFDVTVYADLKSHDLQKWYKANMADRVEAYHKERSTPKIKTDF